MDDTPQTEHGTGLAGLIAPVGRRVLGRHARLMRATGLRLGEAVAARHEPPEAAKAARRLAPVRLVTRAAAPAPAAAAPAAPGAPAAPASPPSGTESTIMPGLSDWAAEYMFGDADAAVSTAQPWMGGAGLTPRTPEERRLSRIKRGGPEVARGAKILEGDETLPAASPKRLARRPSDASSEPTAGGASAPTVAREAAAPARESAAGTTSRPDSPESPTGTTSLPDTPESATGTTSLPDTPESPAATTSRPVVARETATASEPQTGATSRPVVARQTGVTSDATSPPGDAREATTAP
ncbi:MAG TPA: hypothetical protein VFX51_13465, partial [Solirubrobacteraceae bacterium]|nr:hypothetical protein [Solirubrobacteraceae bacterium]